MHNTTLLALPKIRKTVILKYYWHFHPVEHDMHIMSTDHYINDINQPNLPYINTEIDYKYQYHLHTMFQDWIAAEWFNYSTINSLKIIHLSKKYSYSYLYNHILYQVIKFYPYGVFYSRDSYIFMCILLQLQIMFYQACTCISSDMATVCTAFVELHLKYDL